MFFGISHIDLQVVDLKRSREFWSGVIGFSVSREGDGYIELDSGNVAMRLIEVSAVEQSSTIRLSVPRVGEAFEHLVGKGAVARYEPMNTPDLQRMACVTDYDGHSIVLWRELNEDEWGFVPELHKTGEWMPEAEDLVVRLLSHVPAFFRMLARRRVIRVVEQLAREEDSPVTPEHVIRGYITSSAKVTRGRLVEPLKAEGIDPDDYQAEFDYE